MADPSAVAAEAFVPMEAPTVAAVEIRHEEPPDDTHPPPPMQQPPMEEQGPTIMDANNTPMELVPVAIMNQEPAVEQHQHHQEQTIHEVAAPQDPVDTVVEHPKEEPTAIEMVPHHQTTHPEPEHQETVPVEEAAAPTLETKMEADMPVDNSTVHYHPGAPVANPTIEPPVETPQMMPTPIQAEAEKKETAPETTTEATHVETKMEENDPMNNDAGGNHHHHHHHPAAPSVNPESAHPTTDESKEPTTEPINNSNEPIKHEPINNNNNEPNNSNRYLEALAEMKPTPADLKYDSTNSSTEQQQPMPPLGSAAAMPSTVAVLGDGSTINLERPVHKKKCEVLKRRQDVTTVVTRTGKTWNEMFDILVQYKKNFGDTHVPDRFKWEGVCLGLWVRNQRRRETSLTPEQHRRLTELGLDWQTQNERFDNVWHERYAKLTEYRLEHGDCKVPYTYKKDPALAKWVSQQRAQQAQGRLAPERKAKLDAIDFSWKLNTVKNRNTKTEDMKWQRQYEKLIAFHQEHQHCKVPDRYKPDRPLGTWVKKQRLANACNQLKEERKKLLDELGFVWRITDKTDGDKWDKMFQQLKKYKEENGTCHVSRTVPDGDLKPLARWVKTQRALYKSGKILSDRQERLESIAFVWDGTQLPIKRKRRRQSEEGEAIIEHHGEPLAKRTRGDDVIMEDQEGGKEEEMTAKVIQQESPTKAEGVSPGPVIVDAENMDDSDLKPAAKESAAEVVGEAEQGTNDVAVVVAAETEDKALVSTNDTQPVEQSAEVPAEQATKGPSQVENSAPITAAATQPEANHKTENSQPEATATAQPEAPMTAQPEAHQEAESSQPEATATTQPDAYGDAPVTAAAAQPEGYNNAENSAPVTAGAAQPEGYDNAGNGATVATFAAHPGANEQAEERIISTPAVPVVEGTHMGFSGQEALPVENGDLEPPPTYIAQPAAPSPLRRTSKRELPSSSSYQAQAASADQPQEDRHEEDSNKKPRTILDYQVELV
ncbi:helicase [Seminavis robusta]|uniref:Helicase n=1 Tax=Seminavis robusta TaxID=568900 RepID=A0A9N8HR73_9STRA|nr:helicase [Seminavis robusta]|eukprot:Sro1285_g259300.1 helicase (999) ;mRNA; f:8416-11992